MSIILGSPEPDASSIKRGVVNNTTQTFSGSKTFTSTLFSQTTNLDSSFITATPSFEFQNLGVSGNTILKFSHNGFLKGGIRNDPEGNFNWYTGDFLNGYYQFNLGNDEYFPALLLKSDTGIPRALFGGGYLTPLSPARVQIIKHVDDSLALTADGLIESTVDGFKFPDGTIQATAAFGTGTNTGDVTVGTPANGLSIATGQVLTLASATELSGGAIDTDVQSFAGLKTFTNTLTASQGIYSPYVINTNGSGATDIAVKIGTSLGSLNNTAKLLSVRSNVGSIEGEYFSVGKLNSYFYTTLNLWGDLVFRPAMGNKITFQDGTTQNTAAVNLTVGSPANGLSIASGEITLAAASDTLNGAMTVDTQSFSGLKTFLSTLTASQGVVSPSIYNTNGNGATDIAIKVGTSLPPAAISATAKLFSVRSNIGNVESEYFNVLKSGATFYNNLNLWGDLVFRPAMGGKITFQDGTTQNTAATATGTNTGDVTIGTPANGLSIATGQILTLDSASATGGGAVDTTTQTFAGAKTFNSLLTASGNILTPVVYNSTGTLGTDKVVRVGSSQTYANLADGASLASIAHTLTGTPVDAITFNVDKVYTGSNIKLYNPSTGALGATLGWDATNQITLSTTYGSLRVATTGAYLNHTYNGICGIVPSQGTIVAAYGATTKVYSSLGAGATDIGVKIGLSTADTSVDPAAKLLSLRTGIGTGSEVEHLSIVKGRMSLNGASLNSGKNLFAASLGNSIFEFSQGAADVTPSFILKSTTGKACGLGVGTNNSFFAFDDAGDFLITSESRTNFNAGTIGGTTRLQVTKDGKVSINGASLNSGKNVFAAIQGNNIFEFSNGASDNFPGLTIRQTGGKAAIFAANLYGAWQVYDSSGNFYITSSPRSEIDSGTISTIDNKLSITGNIVRVKEFEVSSPVVGGTICAQVKSTGLINQAGTDSSGTPGAATINKPTGISAIASGASSVTITNSLATATSRVMITWNGDHGASRSWVTRASGSFTVNLSNPSTSDVSFSWEVSSII